jgi:hypothetical protein
LSQLGPVVAGSVEAAIQLCGEALADWEGRAVVVDVPVAQADFLAWLQDAGFVVQRPFTRMIRGALLPRPASAVRTFAICGPEFG